MKTHDLARPSLAVAVVALAVLGAAGAAAGTAPAAVTPASAAVATASPTVAGTVPAAPVGGSIEVVESVPEGTVYGQPELRDAPDVWPAMIGQARRTLDIGTFYFSDDPRGDDALDRVLAAVAAAARRGVRVRAIADKRMNGTYPEICTRLAAWPGAECRLLDARTLWGGVQHAKLFIVDGEEFFVGSQNWDWRALEHIREVGVRVRSPLLAGRLAAVYALDWALAGGEAATSTTAAAGAAPLTAEPAASVTAATDRLLTARGDTVAVTLAASPPAALPAGVPWDWPLLEAAVDSARARVRLQMLSYSPAERGGAYWDRLDAALRRAGARGVKVQVILSNWAKRKSSLPWIRSLAAVPNVEVRFTNIPEAASGFIPYARVEHAKYLVADDDVCWVGTSNGSRDYFHESRNVSLFCRGRPGQGVARDLIAFFEAGWNGPYAEPVSPCGEYAPPRIGE